MSRGVNQNTFNEINILSLMKKLDQNRKSLLNLNSKIVYFRNRLSETAGGNWRIVIPADLCLSVTFEIVLFTMPYQNPFHTPSETHKPENIPVLGTITHPRPIIKRCMAEDHC